VEESVSACSLEVPGGSNNTWYRTYRNAYTDRRCYPWGQTVAEQLMTLVERI
jgi:hypothetical protein